MSVSREKLYEEVWAEPMTTVAKRYDVSSSFLARVCERMGVPRPSRGYWAQRAFGMEVEQPALPASEPGSDLEWVRDGSQPRKQPMSVHAASRRPRKQERPATHPLLVGARAHFDHAREARDGQYVRPFKRHIVDVFVSKAFLDDALKFANELFLTLENRGHRVVFASDIARSERVAPEVCVGLDELYYHAGPGRWRPSCPTVVIIEDVAIGLAIFEIGENVEARYDSKLHRHVQLTAAHIAASELRRTRRTGYQDYTTTRWLPSGRIGVLAYATKRGIDWKRYWRESKPGEFLGKLDTFSKELKRTIPTIRDLIAKGKREAEEASRRWEVQQRDWARQNAERERAELETRREKRIADVVAQLRFARDIRAYVSEVQALVKDAGLALVKGGDADQELAWALAYADRIDPLTLWREDIGQVHAAEQGEPCPKCGKVHVAVEGAHGRGDGRPKVATKGSEPATT